MVDLVAVLLHHLVVYDALCDHSLPGGIQQQFSLICGSSQVLGHFSQSSNTEQWVSVCFGFIFCQAEIYGKGPCLMEQSSAAEVVVEYWEHPVLALVLGLQCHVIQCFAGRLQKQVTTHIGRHFLAQEGQALLVHPVVGTPLHECRQTVCSAAHEVLELYLKAVVHQLIEQAAQRFPRGRALFDLTGNGLEVSLEHLHAAECQIICKTVNAVQQVQDVRVRLPGLLHVRLQLLSRTGGEENIHCCDQVH